VENKHEKKRKSYNRDILTLNVSAVSAACFFSPQANSSCPAIIGRWVSSDTHSRICVTSRIDYCNAVLAVSPRFTTDQLQAAASDEFCRPRRHSSATLRSSTAAGRGYYTTSSTGSTSQTEYDSSSLCWCRPIGLFMERLRCTWWTAAHQPPTFLVVTRQHLRSASQRKLIVPRYRLYSFGHRCFATQANITIPRLNPSQRPRYTRFTYPEGMEGWVDLGDWLHAETAYPVTTHPQTVTHPSRLLTRMAGSRTWDLLMIDHKSDVRPNQPPTTPPSYT